MAINKKTQRAVVRYTHLAVGLALGTYVYLPLHLEAARAGLRGFLMVAGVPAIVATGVWLWKGAALRRLITGTTATVLAVTIALGSTASAQEVQQPAADIVAQQTPESPSPQGHQGEPQVGYVPACQKINKGGPVAGIVVASVFWWLLPMSIPVWITQAKKLKRRKAAIYEQQQRGCP